ncbi:MAG: hypothetical protein ACK56I_29940, partial [bacterium]
GPGHPRGRDAHPRLPLRRGGAGVHRGLRRGIHRRAEPRRAVAVAAGDRTRHPARRHDPDPRLRGHAAHGPRRGRGRD